MKAFNLEAALRGEPVVTRSGDCVTIGTINRKFMPHCVLIGWINNMACTWYEDGRHGTNLCYDLFMAEKPKVKKDAWVVLNSKTQEIIPCFLPKEQAEHIASLLEDRVVGHMQWEEEA